MTGGTAVILGSIGANFGAGMTGGMAYVYDPEGKAPSLINQETLVFGRVEVQHWQDELQSLIERHSKETGSVKAEALLRRWSHELTNFIQVCPKEMLDKLAYPISLDQSAVPAE